MGVTDTTVVLAVGEAKPALDLQNGKAKVGVAMKQRSRLLWAHSRFSRLKLPSRLGRALLRAPPRRQDDASTVTFMVTEERRPSCYAMEIQSKVLL